MASKKDEITSEIMTKPEVVEVSESVETSVTQVENVEPETPEIPVITPNTPQSLDVFAAKHRVPAWQAAALNRYMGWEPGKLVSDVDYVAALTNLNARRLGGGRKE